VARGTNDVAKASPALWRRTTLQELYFSFFFVIKIMQIQNINTDFNLPRGFLLEGEMEGS
jgi:hypothetical protein